MVAVVPVASKGKSSGVHERMSGRALVVCLLAALAGLMFGLDIGVISGALTFIGKHFGASSRTQEWIVSSMMAGRRLLARWWRRRCRCGWGARCR